MTDSAYGPLYSDAALNAGLDAIRSDAAPEGIRVADAMHDPALGRDASVNLGWVIDTLMADNCPLGSGAKMNVVEYLARRWREASRAR